MLLHACMQQMLMSIKWCQRFIESRGAVNIFQPEVGIRYNVDFFGM